MKKSELEQLIINAIWHDDDSRYSDIDAAQSVIAALEKAGLLDPTYLVKGKDGMHKIEHGWEDE